MYFEGLKTENEIKARYKELAKKHHPDLGGCANMMKEINNQYEKVLKGSYQESGKSEAEIDDLLAKDEKLREKLNAIITLPDLIIEICGAWIWVTGETRTHKDKLKSCQFFWAKKKGAWYWRSEENRSFNRKAMSLDDIRKTHGSITLSKEKVKMVA